MPPDLTPVALYNLRPIVQLMAVGVVFALVFWAWMHWRHGRMAPAKRLRVLALLTLFLTFDLVIFGAFTRLTDSGLGCPDWPGCYGSASPLGAQLHIDQAQTAMPTGPVTHTKAWIEMVHRYLATGVGVLILTMTVLSWRAHGQAKKRMQRAPATSGPSQAHKMRRDKRAAQRASVARVDASLVTAPGWGLSPWWATFTLLWVCLQGAFGALTVTMKLFPLIVTMHLLGGLILLALLKVQTVQHGWAQVDSVPGPAWSPRLRVAVLACFALLWAQLALGGWVSTNYAVLACTDFPQCQNSWWPAMDLRQGFTLWRELGAGRQGENLSFQALTGIHYVHRLMAYVVFAALLALAAVLRQTPAWRRSAHWLAGLTLLQAATGMGNVVLGWPLFAAVSHTGGAAALVLVLTGLLVSSRRQPAHAPASSLTGSRLSV